MGAQQKQSITTTFPTALAIALAHTPTTTSLARTLGRLFDSSTDPAHTQINTEPIITLVAMATSSGTIQLGDIRGSNRKNAETKTSSTVSQRQPQLPRSWINVGSFGTKDSLSKLFISIDNNQSSTSSGKQQGSTKSSADSTPISSKVAASRGLLLHHPVAATVTCCLGFDSGLVKIFEIILYDPADQNTTDHSQLVQSTLKYERRLHNGPVTSFFHVNHIARAQALARQYKNSTMVASSASEAYTYNNSDQFLSIKGDATRGEANSSGGPKSSGSSAFLSEMDFSIASVCPTGSTICLHRSSDFRRYGMLHGATPTADDTSGTDYINGVYVDAESEYCLVTMAEGKAYLWQLLTGILERIYFTPKDYLHTIDPSANLLQTSLLEDERSLPIFADHSVSSSTDTSLSLSATKLVEILRYELTIASNNHASPSNQPTVRYGFTPTVLRGLHILYDSLYSLVAKSNNGSGATFRSDIETITEYFTGSAEKLQQSSGTQQQLTTTKSTTVRDVDATEVLYCVIVLSEIEKSSHNTALAQAANRIIRLITSDLPWALPDESLCHSSEASDTDNFDCYTALAARVISVISEMVPLLLGVDVGTFKNNSGGPLISGAAIVIASALAHISHGPWCTRCKVNLRKVATATASTASKNHTYGRGSIIIHSSDGPKHLLFEVFMTMLADPSSCHPPPVFAPAGPSEAAASQTLDSPSASVDQSAYMFLLSTIACTLLNPANDKQVRLIHDAILDLEFKVLSYLQVSTNTAPPGNNAMVSSVLQLLSDNWLSVRPYLKNPEQFLRGIVVHGCLRDATAPSVKSASLKALSTCFLAHLRAGNNNLPINSNGGGSSAVSTPTASGVGALSPTAAPNMRTKEDVTLTNSLWEMLNRWFSTGVSSFHPDLLWKGNVSTSSSTTPSTSVNESLSTTTRYNLRECSDTHRVLIINCFTKMIQCDPVDILVNDGLLKILPLLWIAIDPHSPSRLEREACFPSVASLFRAAVKNLPFFTFQQKFQRIAVGHNNGCVSVFDVKSADEITKFVAFEATGASARILNSSVPTLFSANSPLPANAIAAVAYSNINHEIAVVSWDLRSLRIFHASGSSTFFIPSSYSHFKLRKEVLITSPAVANHNSDRAAMMPKQAVERCALVWLSPHCIELTSPWHERVQLTI